MADGPWLSRDSQSTSDDQGYSDKEVLEYAWLTVRGCPGIVRVCTSDDRGYSDKGGLPDY